MFKLTPAPNFWAKAFLSIPGEAKPASLDIQFRHLTRPQIKEFFANLEGKTDSEALAEVIVSWKGIDANYSVENLATLLDNYPTAGGELFESFRTELLEARRKN